MPVGPQRCCCRRIERHQSGHCPHPGRARREERIAAAADALRADGFDLTHHAGDVRDASAMQAIMTKVTDATVPIDIVLSGAAGNFFVPAAKMSTNI
jgi:NADP-dependent 3-hydroxy acid dehydrogenase YdfG